MASAEADKTTDSLDHDNQSILEARWPSRYFSRFIYAKMDHLIQLLSTTSGTDDLFMLVQYSAIILRQLVSRGKDGKDNKGLVLRLSAFIIDYGI
ncbi:hypothetical protein Pst134EB_016880 [Puccinia striiformis f. sp. tritici]|nr:hypothetical protein Pst134EB_016880 [Puccinia striiformis f. sp. tritici]